MGRISLLLFIIYYFLPMYEVTFLPILFAGIANMILGMIWYDPRVLGATWMRLANITPEMTEAGKKTMPLRMVMAFCAAMVVAYVLNWFGIAWGVYDWATAVELGIWAWVGFVAPIMLGSVLWDMRPFKLFVLNAGYWLISLVMMSVILTL